jgi:hypothetical protein
MNTGHAQMTGLEPPANHEVTKSQGGQVELSKRSISDGFRLATAAQINRLATQVQAAFDLE